LAAQGVEAQVQAGESAVGGGSLPGETLPTMLLAVHHVEPDGVATQLRSQAMPVVGRIRHDQLLFDPRTVLQAQEKPLLRALCAVLAG
jgi:L-seryl-tRNA(Ser) seleniumtransferase